MTFVLFRDRSSLCRIKVPGSVSPDRSVQSLPLVQEPAAGFVLLQIASTRRLWNSKWMSVGWASTVLSVRDQWGKPARAWEKAYQYMMIGGGMTSVLSCEKSGAPRAERRPVQGTDSHRPGGCC